jgi:hypothetical protein
VRIAPRFGHCWRLPCQASSFECCRAILRKCFIGFPSAEFSPSATRPASPAGASDESSSRRMSPRAQQMECGIVCPQALTRGSRREKVKERVRRRRVSMHGSEIHILGSGACTAWVRLRRLCGGGAQPRATEGSEECLGTNRCSSTPRKKSSQVVGRRCVLHLQISARHVHASFRRGRGALNRVNR